jgi:cytochrome c553
VGRPPVGGVRLQADLAALLVASGLMLAGAAGPRALGTPASAAPMPPPRLADTGLYQLPVRPFSPQYPLWSDGAAKSRWVYLPPGSAIDVSNPDDWEFPVGTRFWKEFRFAGRKVETRLIWKATTSEWVFAAYAWNDAGTDAMLAPADGLATTIETAPGRRLTIPSVTDCAACHGTTRRGPLGFNALQLSSDRDPNAVHGEPLDAEMLTLETLVGEGRLTPAPARFLTDPPRIRSDSPRTRAVLGYFAANCGGCHNGSQEITVTMPSLRHDAVLDGDHLVRELAERRTKWQVPGQADGTSVLLAPGDPLASAMLVRMRSRRPSSQMPPLGTVARDTEAVALVERWIADGLK